MQPPSIRDADQRVDSEMRLLVVLETAAGSRRSDASRGEKRNEQT
jgi:hypothetical protein